MTEGTVFFVKPDRLPPAFVGCAVVQVAGAVFRVVVETSRRGAFPVVIEDALPVEVAELGDLAELLSGRDPWRIKARGRWTPNPLRGRYVADDDGGRDVGPLGDLQLLEVLGEPLNQAHLAAIRAAADSAVQVRLDMSKWTA